MGKHLGLGFCPKPAAPLAQHLTQDVQKTGTIVMIISLTSAPRRTPSPLPAQNVLSTLESFQASSPPQNLFRATPLENQEAATEITTKALRSVPSVAATLHKGETPQVNHPDFDCQYKIWRLPPRAKPDHVTAHRPKPAQPTLGAYF